MKTNYEIRYAAHPEDAKSYDTARLRRDFLIEKVFTADEVNMVYSMYDRMVVGGAMPVAETLRLEAIDPLKAPFFLTRREMGIYNVGVPSPRTARTSWASWAAWQFPLSSVTAMASCRALTPLPRS